MAAGGHIGNVTWKQIDIESCVIPPFLLILAWRIHFWHRFCILTGPTFEIQDGRLRPYWKCNFKVNGHRNPCNITFPTKCDIESPFLASFFYLKKVIYLYFSWWSKGICAKAAHRINRYCLKRVSDVTFSRNNGSNGLNLKTMEMTDGDHL